MIDFIMVNVNPMEFWTKFYDTTAKKQGWTIFVNRSTKNHIMEICAITDTVEMAKTLGVSRIPSLFDSEAQELVRAQASNGDEMSKIALELHGKPFLKGRKPILRLLPETFQVVVSKEYYHERKGLTTCHGLIAVEANTIEDARNKVQSWMKPLRDPQNTLKITDPRIDWQDDHPGEGYEYVDFSFAVENGMTADDL